MDWYGIWAGTVGWPADEGACTPQDVPQGVRLSLQPPQLTEPFLQVGDRPWEAHLGYMQVMYDEGRYRLWYEASPSQRTAEQMKIAPIGGGGYPGFTCYAESVDGFHWAAGVASALAARKGIRSADVPIRELQSELLQQKVHLGGPDRLRALGLVQVETQLHLHGE